MKSKTAVFLGLLLTVLVAPFSLAGEERGVMTSQNVITDRSAEIVLDDMPAGLREHIVSVDSKHYVRTPFACTAGQPILCGLTLRAMVTTDCVANGGIFYAGHAFTAQRGYRSGILFESTAFDPYVVVLDYNTGEILAQDDNSGGGTSAFVVFDIPQTLPDKKVFIGVYAYPAGTAGVFEASALCLVNSTYALTVSKAGSGSGTVTSNPAGISCGTDCSENFASGTSVTLTATPSQGSTFAGWSGACSGTGACTVSMTASKSVTATFNASQPQTCVPNSTTACMLGNRFRVTVRYRSKFDNSAADADAQKKNVTGFANPSYETAFFYFNSENNIEMMVKMLDQGNTDSSGRPTIAVLTGSATPLRIEIAIQDTKTGATRNYMSEFGKQKGETDFTAFVK